MRTKRKRSGTVKLVIGVIAGLYALAQSVRVVLMLGERATGPYSEGTRLGSLAGLVIGGIISVVCLWSIFRYRKPVSRRTHQQEPAPDWLSPPLYHPPAVLLPNATTLGNANNAAPAPETRITVSTVVAAPLAEVWRAWMTEAELAKWNAEPDEAGMGFDFAGAYTAVVPHERIEAEFGGRKLVVEFAVGPGGVTVRETFDAEETHPVEVQRAGWQAILDRFAKHVEGR